MWPSNECKLPKLARKSSEALVYKMSVCIFHFMVKLKKNSLIVAKIRRYVWAHVRACVGGCLGLPLFSDVVLSACPASWDREQEIKMKKKKKSRERQRNVEGCSDALQQRCLSALWIFQLDHRCERSICGSRGDATAPSRPCPTHVVARTQAHTTLYQKKNQLSQRKNLCHPLPHHITSLSGRQWAAVCETSGETDH